MVRFIQQQFIQPLKDFLFVSSCFHCGGRLSDGERRVCGSCLESLKKVAEDDYTVQVLRKRFRGSGVIDDVASLYYFEKGKVLQSLAHSLKYEEVTSFGVELGIQLGEKLSSKNIHIDVIIPVPLNKQKERERGYNQSEFVAKGVAKALDVPVYTRVIHRIKYTVTQTRLNAREREENVSDAFVISDPETIKNKTVLVVDDIITTGSTIQEVARILKDAGAAKIIAGSVGLAQLGEDA